MVIVLAIISMLLFQVIPSFTYLLHQHRVKRTQALWISALNTTKTLAYRHYQRAYLCPWSLVTERCVKFTENYQALKVSLERRGYEALVQFFDLPVPLVSVELTQLGSKSRIMFNRHGRSLQALTITFQNGNSIRQIRLSRLGRIRTTSS